MEDRGIVTGSGIYRGRVRGAWTRGNAEGRKMRKKGFDEDGSGGSRLRLRLGGKDVRGWYGDAGRG